MLGVPVGIPILANLPLLEFVGVMSGRSNRFGISLYAHSLLDIRLGNIGVDRTRRKRRVRQVRCPDREGYDQRKGCQ